MLIKSILIALVFVACQNNAIFVKNDKVFINSGPFYNYYGTVVKERGNYVIVEFPNSNGEMVQTEISKERLELVK